MERRLSIFGIADLHLTFSGYPPEGMRKFGKCWDGHPDIIIEKWNSVVGKDDTTILVGDTSWAKKAMDAIDDMNFLTLLNGTKILIEGNHDRWMKNRGAAEAILPEGVILLGHGFMKVGDIGIIGWRGLSFENPYVSFPKETKRFYSEYRRFSRAGVEAEREQLRRIIWACHFPPFERLENYQSEFTEAMQWPRKSGDCIFGHIHNKEEWDRAYQGHIGGVDFHLVAADYLQFIPKLIVDNPHTV